jgi:hypothetical protein
MLDDPRFSFQQIGQKFGLTKQRIAQLAKELGINSRQRQRERTLNREPHIIEKDYRPDVHAVIEKIRRCGIRVLPHNALQPSRANLVRRSQRMVLVNGVLCVVQVRPAQKFRPNGREYVRFDVGPETRRAKAAVFAMLRGRTITKLYIVPIPHLKNVSSIYIPADGKYAVASGKKPQRDWTRYEDAWHLLGESRNRTGRLALKPGLAI